MAKRGGKSQIAMHPILFLSVAFGFALVSIIGIKIYAYIKDTQCNTALITLASNIRSDFDGLAWRQGSIKEESYVYACETDALYFVDHFQNIPQDAFNKSPEIQDSLFANTGHNLFILRNGKLFTSFDIGKVSLAHPHYRCFNTSGVKKLEFLMQGVGDGISIAHTENFKGSGYDCTNYGLPEEIPVEPGIEKASLIISNSASYLATTFGLDQNQAIQRFNQTEQRVEIDREFERLANGTKVKIKIRPKSQKIIDNFILIEDIPKACLSFLTDYEIQGNGDVVSQDPVIAWHFASIEGRQEASYFIPDLELKERCKDLIDGVGLAENFVDSIESIQNEPPILAIPNLFLSEDDALTTDLAPYISDPDNLKRQLKATISTPVNLQAQLNEFTLIITPNPNWYGTEKLFITVQDQSEATTQEIVATVHPTNDGPVITSTPQPQALQFQPYTYKVTATDVDAEADLDVLKYALLEYPAGMAIDQSGLITFTPQQHGRFTVKVQVSDRGTSAVQDYILEVQRVNKAPQFANLPQATVAGLIDSKDRNNVIANLWIFVSDDSDTKTLEYAVIAQTNPGLVSCYVDSINNLDCSVHKTEEGYSDISLSVYDGQYSAYTTTRVTVKYSENGLEQDNEKPIEVSSSSAGTTIIMGNNPQCPSGNSLRRYWSSKTCSDQKNCNTCSTSATWSDAAPTCLYGGYHKKKCGSPELTCTASTWSQVECACTKNPAKICENNDVYEIDSCGAKSVRKYCADFTCRDGKCCYKSYQGKCPWWKKVFGMCEFEWVCP